MAWFLPPFPYPATPASGELVNNLKHLSKKYLSIYFEMYNML